MQEKKTTQQPVYVILRWFQIVGLNARISAVYTVLLMDMTVAVLVKHDASLSGVMIHNWQGLREERWFP